MRLINQATAGKICRSQTRRQGRRLNSKGSYSSPSELIRFANVELTARNLQALKKGMMIIMRIMGLDYGSVTVGVAISDELLLTAQGIEVIRRKQENKLRQTLARIEKLIQEYDVNKIVLGYPKHLNNTIGERALKSEKFAERLRARTGLEVILWDERLTTVAAHQVLDQTGMNVKDKALVVDKLAAVLILQGYLDKFNFTKNN